MTTSIWHFQGFWVKPHETESKISNIACCLLQATVLVDHLLTLGFSSRGVLLKALNTFRGSVGLFSERVA